MPPTVATATQWPIGWFVLGAATSAIALAFGFFWWDEDDPTPPATTRLSSAAKEESGLRPAELAYFMFGLGYIAYVTFVVAYLRNSGADDGDIIGFWTLLGAASIVANFLWPRLTSRFDITLAATLAVCAAGVAVVVASSSLPAAILSAILFGGSFLAVVGSVTGLARDRLPPDRWAGAIARMTVIFGVGQTLGPILAGLLGDTDAGLRIGLGASVAALGAGAIIATGSFRSVE